MKPTEEDWLVFQVTGIATVILVLCALFFFYGDTARNLALIAVVPAFFCGACAVGIAQRQ